VCKCEIEYDECSGNISDGFTCYACKKEIEDEKNIFLLRMFLENKK
jgi:hypothetical protein